MATDQVSDCSQAVKPALARWFIPGANELGEYPVLFKHRDGIYRPAPPGYVWERHRGGWTHPAFKTP